MQKYSYTCHSNLLCLCYQYTECPTQMEQAVSPKRLGTEKVKGSLNYFSLSTSVPEYLRYVTLQD